MTGHEYANLIAEYILRRFGDRGIQVYREVHVGKSIIGKKRRIDILVLTPEQPPQPQRALAIECKYQGSQGTVDEKIPYALQDMEALPMRGVIAYAGDGFSAGVRHMLEAAELSAFCLPAVGQQESSAATQELDHQLAMNLGWWDVLVQGKRPFVLPELEITSAPLSPTLAAAAAEPNAAASSSESPLMLEEETCEV
jgi:hypothetical protein